MTRYARRQSESNIYHIMVRGNERKEIFLDDEDRRRYLDTIEKMKGQNCFAIYSYCLMSNHVHLLIREGNEPIHKSMKKIGVSYSYYFNKKYCRVGHLFQDRFRSEAVEIESFFLAASRYIHNNPVKAGLVHVPEDYRWSSYNTYIYPDLCNRRSLVECDFILSILSDKKEKAVDLFKEYTMSHNEDKFMDLNGTDEINTEVNDNFNEIGKLANILRKYNLDIDELNCCTDKVLRNNVLREIKAGSGISLRHLEKVTGISKDIIFRA